jgi:hypothetical protein
MQDWMLPHITSFWDERMEAIERFSRVIAAVPEADRAADLSALTAAVVRHTQALTDADLVKFTVPIVEDLYKAVARRSRYDEPLFQYLEASCKPFFQALTERGYVVHYFIDNAWDRLEGPAIGFPLWFGTAKLAYICPQEVACHDFEKNKPAAEWPALVTKYIGKGREVAQELAIRCHAAGRHLVYLDIDARGGDFDFATKLSQAPGVIFVFRQEAPNPGTRCAVRLPTEPRKAQSAADTKAPPPAPAPTSASPSTPAVQPPASSGSPILKPQVDGLVGGNEESRRTNRRVLRAALAEALIGSGALDALKADLVAFHNAGWALIGEAEYGDGEYTLAAAINTLISAIQRRPELKAWLPLVANDRVKRFMTAPVADLNDAAWSELDKALDEAAKFGTPT